VGPAGNSLILLVSILAGLLAGLTRAWVHKSGLHIPDFRLIWLVPAAFLLQALAFYLPGFGRSIPIQLVSFLLVTSQTLLLIFSGVNLRLSGFWLLGLGLLLNLLVIVLNGGLMPISPETVMRLMPNATPGSWATGARLGVTKDLVLPEAKTIFAFLSDRFILPNWFNRESTGNAVAAFSVGDVVISLGAFGVLWSFGRPTKAI
jgi:hypothetical protein